MKAHRGIGIPTGTTLLAALWPDHHHIHDVRVAAAAGLALADAQEPVVGHPPDATVSAGRSWEEYADVRGRLLATATATGRPLHVVERALYRLDQATATQPDRTWEAYATAITITVHTAA